MPLFSNGGFSGFLKHTLCSLDRLNMSYWFVIAFDNSTCPGLEPSFGLRNTHSSCIYPYSTHDLQSGEVAKYRSSGFNMMVMQRPMWVMRLLKHGYEVIQADLDLGWLHSPIDYFSTTSADFMAMSESGHGYNAGVYLAMPTNATINLFRIWLKKLTDSATSKHFEEQHALNHAIAYARRMNGTFKKLPETAFVNGKLWWQYNRPPTKAGVAIIHANWNKHNKKGRLKRDNLWALDRLDSHCMPTWNPFAHNCTRWCIPVQYCRATEICKMYTSCQEMNASFKRGTPLWHHSAFDVLGC